MNCLKLLHLWITGLIMTGVCGSNHSDAAVLAYDGFASGGSSPTASQYNTGAAYPYNALAYYEPAPSTVGTGGQNPTTTGFTGAWIAPLTSSGQTASSVNFRALSTSLNYTDTLGNSLVTTPGSASIARSGAGSTEKTIYRALDIPSVPNTGYISVLVNFNAGQPIEFDFKTLGASSKPHFGFGIDANGTPYVQLSNTTNYQTSQEKVFASESLAPNQTHLLVLKVDQTVPATLDVLSLFVNPLLSAPLSSASAVLSGDFYVAGNPDYHWTNLHITGIPNSGAFMFDEFQISDQWSIMVPEPGITGLSGLAIICFFLRRRRAHA